MGHVNRFPWAGRRIRRPSVLRDALDRLGPCQTGGDPNSMLKGQGHPPTTGISTPFCSPGVDSIFGAIPSWAVHARASFALWLANSSDKRKVGRKRLSTVPMSYKERFI